MVLCSYPFTIIEKGFLKAKLQETAPKKEEIFISFVSAHYISFNSKSISITANVKDNKSKKVFDKCKVIHTLKQPKNLLRSLIKAKFQTCISEKYGLYLYECKDFRCNRLYRYECKDFRCNLCAWYIILYKNVQVS